MDTFVGREKERALAARAVERAIAGHGGVLVLMGPAGIGKSRLAHVIAQGAAERGTRVAWGRTWEAGDAPAYLPWSRAFRALGVTDDPFSGSAALGAGDAREARFAIFERATQRLSEIAAPDGLVIVLDDLHAADVASLLFLTFLASQLDTMRLLVVATHRDLDPRIVGETSALLSKVGRMADTLHLAGLTVAEVFTWMEQEVKSSTTLDLATRVQTLADGNALFVSALVRRIERGEDLSADAELGRLLDEPLARLSEGAQETLAVASVLGREVDTKLLAALLDRPLDAVEVLVREAQEAGIVTPISNAERVVFSHILVRDRLYDRLLSSHRAALHRRAARWLLASTELESAMSHLLRSDAPSEEIGSLARTLADRALARMAFEDAVAVSERALERHAGVDTLHLDLQLRRAEGMFRGGDVAAARELCIVIAQRSRDLGYAEGEARAALVYGLDVALGGDSGRIVSLLRDALASLPEADSPLRASVHARYALALTPPRTRAALEASLAEGARAVAMARRLGDHDALLYALRMAGSPSLYLVGAERRARSVREIVALAEGLERPMVILDVGGWWLAALREEGALVEHDAAMAKLERLTTENGRPIHRARLAMWQATDALLQGDDTRRRELVAKAHALLDAASAPIFSFMLGMFDLASADFGMAPASTRIEAPDDPRLTNAPGWLRVAGLAVLGFADAARTLAARERAQLDAALFPWVLGLGIAAARTHDVDTATVVLPMLEACARDQTCFWGIFAVGVLGPVQRVAGDLASLLGRTDEARRWYDETIEIGERMRAPAIVSLARARRDALGPAASGVPKSKAPAVRAIEITRDGDAWRLVWGATSILVRDGKGMQYLAELIVRPGVELHVTQLVGLETSSADGAPALDAKAKAAYGARARSLKAELDEARAWSDAGRITKIERELETIAEQLASSVGLGGRDRKLGSEVERLRINVQRRIKDAIRRIGTHDADLARHLGRAIKTGTYCAYDPR